MFDFPNTPALNQTIVGPGGVSYMWDGTKWIAQAQAQAFQQPFDSTMNAGRNKLHNGLFNVQQRGPGNWTAGGFTADRWALGVSGDTVTVGLSAISDAGRAAIGDEAAQFLLSTAFTGGATAGNFTQVYQHIENVRRLAGKTVIISFWATASAVLNLGVRAQQNFGSGGSPSAQVDITAQIVTLSTTWTRYSLVFTFPSASGKTFGTTAGTDFSGLVFGFSSGSTNSALLGVGVQSGTVNLWGIQLEIAAAGQTQPTPLEKLDPQQDLANCQRFFFSGNYNMQGYTGSGNNFVQTLSFPVTMRASPTIVNNVTSNSGNVVLGSSSVAALYGNAVTVTVQSNTTAAFWYGGTFTASADL